MPNVAAWITDWRGRSLAAVFGATVSAIVAILGFWVALDYVVLVCLFGIPAAAVTGFVFGPRAVATSRPGQVAVLLGLLAVPIGLATVALAGLLVGNADPDILWVVPMGVIAIPYAAPVSVPVSLLAVYVGRRLARRSARQVAAIVAIMAIATVGVGAATRAEAVGRSEAAIDQPQEPHWFERLVSPVDLRWTLINRSERPLLLYVAEPTPDGETGSIQGIAPCSTTSGIEAIGDEWRLHVTPDTGTWPPDHGDPVVTSHERPGPDPVATIEVAADGRAGLAPAGRAPDGC